MVEPLGCRGALRFFAQLGAEPTILLERGIGLSTAVSLLYRWFAMRI